MGRRTATAWRAALTCCFALGVAACTLAAPTPSERTTPPASPPGAPSTIDYVALGDSYTAGPLIPALGGTPPGCLRSSRNYPSLLAQELRPATFQDVSCSGATTANLSRSQRVSLGGRNPPQLDAVRADTDLVTLGIGGNDIGFIEIVNTCARLSPAEPSGAACRGSYTAGGTDQLVGRITDTAPKIATALRAVAERAPDARVLLVGYPVLLPDTGPGCFPDVPFTAGDVTYLRQVEQRLNAMLAEQAGLAGVTYVDTYRPSVGHDWCQPPGTKWVEALEPTAPAAPVHPNALGMQATARAVLAALG